MRKTIFRRSVLALVIAASFTGISTAQNGSWNVNASGNWSDTANWAGGIPANGSGFTATFANDLTDDRTVTLDTARTITNLTFGDANPATAGSWIISNGGTAANILTLAGSTPTITVNALGAGKAVDIGTALAGTSGFTKAGPGLLQLSGSLSGLTGTITVNGGTLQFTNDTATGSAVARSLAGNGTVIYTGTNTGTTTGFSSYDLTGTNSSFSGTMVAKNVRLVMNVAADAGTATLSNSEFGQFYFNGAGPFTNNIIIQGIGWGSYDGNTGAIRLSAGTTTVLSGQITMAGDARITAPGSVSSVISGPIGETGGARTLELGGALNGSTITLSGANTYTGGTIIHGAYDLTGQGTSTSITLNYATQNNSKLGDSGELKFKGISKLILLGGSHAEDVGSTTIDTGAFATISRFSASSTLNLGQLTRNSAGILTIDTAAIATTTSGTVGEAFGSWFTLGNELAAKNGSNQIVAATYTDVPTATGTIVDGAASSVRLTNSVAGSVTLGGSAGDTLTINTLNRQVAGLATIDTAGKTLRVRNGILSNSASGGITIGTAADSGTLTAGSASDTAGTLDISTAVGVVTINSSITNNGTGAVTLTKLHAGGNGSELVLNGTNTYSGGTMLNGGGTLRLGSNSALGTGPVTVLYPTTIAAVVGGPAMITIDNEIAINNQATLEVDLNSANFTVNSAITGAFGKLTVSAGKAPNNSLTLTNANTYGGSTEVSKGYLYLGHGGSLGTTDISVYGGFGVRQNANGTTNSVGGSISMGGGSISMADGFTTTLNVGGDVDFYSPTLSFDLGGTTTTTDRLAITGRAWGGPGTSITINGIGTTAPTPGSYPLVTATTGINSFTLTKPKAVINGTAYGISLTNTATASVINVTGLTGLDAAYWKGDQDGAWLTNNGGNTNWSTAADGIVDSGGTPNSLTDVYFIAAGATNLTTSLGADTTIYSLNYTASSSATTIAAGNTLTIGTAGADTTGIRMVNGSAAQTINAPINLSAAQWWMNNSNTNSLTIGGAVNNAGFALTLSGSITINGDMAGSGALSVVNNGNVLINGEYAASGAISVTSSGSTTFSGPLSGGGAFSDNGSGTTTVSGPITGGSAISVTGSGSTILSGPISGTSSISKSGSGTLTVSGANSYTGGTTLTLGILKASSSSALGLAGQALALNNSGTLQLASDIPLSSKNVSVGGNVSVVLDRETSGAGLTTTFGNLTTSSGFRTITVSSGSNVTSGSTSTLKFNGTLSMSGVTTTFAIGAGTALELGGTTASGVQSISIIKNGAGTLIFSGNAGTWDSGNVSLSAGTLELRTRMGDTTQYAAPITAAAGTTLRLTGDPGTSFISNLTVNGSMRVVADKLTTGTNSATYSLGNLSIGAQTLTIARGSNITDAGIGGVTFNQGINAGTGTTTLTGHATFNTEANALLTLKGVTSGAFSLTKSGLGSMTLNAANTYSGGTIVRNGTLNLGFGTTTSNILLSTSALILGGGTLSLSGTGTQTVASLTTALATNSNILLDSNETLTLGALTSAGAGSSLNFNTAAGGANASTSNIGTGIVTLPGQSPGNSINIGYTVTDAGGTGLATVNASNQVIRMNAAISTLLPAAGSVAATDYLIDNNAGGPIVAGSSSLAVTSSQSARTISVDTTAAAGTLTLNTGAALSNNGWLFSGTGNNTYKITGAGTLTSVATGNPITFNNLNTGAVTIESVIAAKGINNVGFMGPGTTIIAATNTYTGVTGIASGVVQVGPGSTLDGLAATGALPATMVTVAAGAKLIYNRAGQTNPLDGGGAVEYYGANDGTTSGTGSAVTLNNGSTTFSGTMLISGIRAAVDSSGDLGSAQITVTPTGQLFSSGATLANNFIISGTGWGETGQVHGALRFDGTSVLNGTITLAGDARIGSGSGLATFNGAIGETGGARKLMLAGGSSTVNSGFRLNAASTYTGGTDLGSLANPTSLVVNLGSDLAFGTGTINVLSTASIAANVNRTLANPFVIAGGKSLTVIATGSTMTLNGGISGPGILFTSGGIVVVNGTNTYTGVTQIGAGTLQVGGSMNTGASNLTIGSTTSGILTIVNGGSFTTTGTTNLGSGTNNNFLNIHAGGALFTGDLNNARHSTYNIDGTLTATGAWSITTSLTSNINGAATGTISAASLSIGNASTLVNFNSLGTTSIAGNLNLAATNSGTVNINAGTVNVGGVTWGGATQIMRVNVGRLNIGASGIAATGGSLRIVDLGNATVGARGADWSSSLSMLLTGTDSGTTFNTLDSADNATARTITLSGNLSGTGKLNKTGAGTLILTGPNTYSGGTTITAGTLQVGPGGIVGIETVTNNATFDVSRAGLTTAAIDGTGSTTVTASGATLTANHIRQSGLAIGAGNTVSIAANGGDSGASVVTNLSINATGKLDLNDNDLIVDNGNLATLTAKLASGLDISGSYGNGPGITSTAFATNPNFNTVLGIAANAELGYSTFSGQAVDANDVLIKYTYYGDADLNGLVDAATDFDLYITGLTSGGSFGGWLYGDFDYNGTVDAATDFDLYITGLTSQGAPLLTTGGGSSITAIPEPSILVSAGIGVLSFALMQLRRRRQKQPAL